MEGSPAPSIDVFTDTAEAKMEEEKSKIDNHEERREELIGKGLHNVLFIRKVFGMTLEEMIDIIIREDERMNNFASYTKQEIAEFLSSSCKAACGKK